MAKFRTANKQAAPVARSGFCVCMRDASLSDDIQDQLRGGGDQQVIVVGAYPVVATRRTAQMVVAVVVYHHVTAGVSMTTLPVRMASLHGDLSTLFGLLPALPGGIAAMLVLGAPALDFTLLALPFPVAFLLALAGFLMLDPLLPGVFLLMLAVVLLRPVVLRMGALRRSKGHACHGAKRHDQASSIKGFQHGNLPACVDTVPTSTPYGVVAE